MLARMSPKFAREALRHLDRNRNRVLGEYVGDYHLHGGPAYLFNSGGGYRITPTQQIDFHFGIGLYDNAPTYIFGIGYSFWFDGLF
jgi:hypothetical protein